MALPQGRGCPVLLPQKCWHVTGERGVDLTVEEAALVLVLCTLR